jgi:integrase
MFIARTVLTTMVLERGEKKQMTKRRHAAATSKESPKDANVLTAEEGTKPSDATTKRRRHVTATGSGHLYEAANAFHIRYWTQEVGENGEMKRVQKSKKLCSKDAQHPNIGCKAVRDLRAEFMVKINTEKPMEGDMLIDLFWKKYIMRCGEILPDGRPRLRSGTVKQYKSVYKRRLEKHFGKLKLSGYTKEMATMYLDELTSKLGLNALRHIRAIARGMFVRAVDENRIKVNPWHQIKIPKEAVKYQTKWYTEPEADLISNALKDRLDVQLAFAIGCYCALRPGEICALRWEDGEGNWLHVRRSYVRGMLDVPKTDSSIAPVVVPPQVRIFLKAWWEKCGCPKEGWIFPTKNNGERPVSLDNLALLVVKPALEKAGIRSIWRGWYACRRSCATWIIENTKGNAALAQQQLRHKSMSTTLNIYKKAISKKGHLEGVLSAFPQLTS